MLREGFSKMRKPSLYLNADEKEPADEHLIFSCLHVQTCFKMYFIYIHIMVILEK